MPKKFKGENTKVVAARERKKNAETQSETSSSKDDWEEHDKQILRKQKRKETEQNKKQVQLQKKAEVKALLEEEMKSINNTKQVRIPKISRAQIDKNIKSLQQKTEHETKGVENEIEANFNRLTLDEEHARNVDEAIFVLTSKNEIDKHPEKRVKAGHMAYKEKRLQELRAENPTLRLSKMKEIIYKEWQNHPGNPLNKSKDC